MIINSFAVIDETGNIVTELMEYESLSGPFQLPAIFMTKEEADKYIADYNLFIKNGGIDVNGGVSILSMKPISLEF
jgi:hypothetical protein